MCRTQVCAHAKPITACWGSQAGMCASGCAMRMLLCMPAVQVTKGRTHACSHSVLRFWRAMKPGAPTLPGAPCCVEERTSHDEWVRTGLLNHMCTRRHDWIRNHQSSKRDNAVCASLRSFWTCDATHTHTHTHTNKSRPLGHSKGHNAEHARMHAYSYLAQRRRQSRLE